MISSSVVREQYLHALRTRYATLSLPISAYGRQVALEAVFQPLRLRAQPVVTQEGQKGKEDTQLVQVNNGAEALGASESRRLIVLGGPGMGKTTLLKDLLLQAITRALDEHSTDPLPVFVSLPDLARAGLSLEAYVESVLIELGVAIEFGETIVAAIESGQAFLCLDSLDEVLPALRPDVIAWINRETVRCSGTWVVGSRFTEYQGGQFTYGAFTEWELLPLDEKLCRQLAEHLLPLLSILLERPESHADEFLRVMRQDPLIAEWQSNPLLFTLAAIAYVRHGLLPSNRSSLYAAIVDVMVGLRNGDVERRLGVREVLARVALDMYQTQGRYFTVDDVRLLLQAYEPEVDTATSYARLDSVLNSGVLDVVAYQTYGFKHQMFQEYLAAVALAHQLMSEDEGVAEEAWQLMVRKRTYTRWKEILRLVVGVLAQEHGEDGSRVAARWLQMLMGERESKDGDPGHLCLLLALGSLQEFPDIEEHVELADVVRKLVVVWAEALFEAMLHVKDFSSGGRSDENGWEYYIDRDVLTLREKSATEYEYIYARLYSALSMVRLLDVSLVLPAIVKWQECYKQAIEHDKIKDMSERAYYGLSLKLDYALPSRVFKDMLPEGVKVNLYTLVESSAITSVVRLEPLIVCLVDEHEVWQARIGAAQLLAKIDDVRVYDVFEQLLKDRTSYYQVRMAIVKALPIKGGERGARILRGFLQDEDERVQKAVWQALPELRRDLLGGFVHDILRVDAPYTVDQCVMFIEACSKKGGILSASFLSALVQAEVDERIQGEAIEAMLYLGKDMPVGLLIDFCAEDQKNFDFIWSEFLYISKKEMPIQLFLDALSDDEPKKRVVAIRLLGLIQSETKLVPLDAILKHVEDPKRDVRVTVLGMLHNFAEPRLVPILAEGLVNEAEEGIAKNSLYSLWWLASKLPDMGQWVTTEHLERALKNGHVSPGDVVNLSAMLRVPLSASILLQMLIERKDNEKTERNTYVSEGIEDIMKAMPVLGVEAPIAAIFELLSNVSRSRKRQLIEMLLSLSKHIPKGLIVEYMQRDVEPVMYVQMAEMLARQGDIIDVDIFSLNEKCFAMSNMYKAAVSLFSILPLDISVKRLLEMLCIHGTLADGIVAAALHQRYQHVTPQMIQSTAHYTHSDVVLSIRVLGKTPDRLPYDFLLKLLDDEKIFDGIRVNAQSELHDHGILIPHKHLIDWVYRSDGYMLVEQMARLSGQAPMDEIITWLQADDHWLGGAGMKALREVGAYAPMDRLLIVLEEGNDDVRKDLLAAFGAFGERAPVEKMLTILQDKNEPLELRVSAFGALTELGVHVPAEVIVELVNLNESYNIGVDMFSSLREMGKDAPLEALLILLEEGWCQHVMWVFGEMGENAPVELMLSMLRDEELDEDERAHVAEGLGALGQYAPLEEMIACLYNKDGEVREGIVDAFGKMGEYAPIKLLLELLDNDDVEIRDAVGYALRDLEDTAPVRLVAEAGHDTRSVVRKRVLKALEHLGKDAPIEILVESLQHEDEEIRRTALVVLAKLPVDVPSILPIDVLLDRLRYENDEHERAGNSERFEVELTLLERYGEAVPVELLLAHLGHSELYEQVAKTLYKTHPAVFYEKVVPEAERILHGGPVGEVFQTHVQTRIARVIGEIGRATPEVLQMLAELLDWPYWETRMMAARSLGMIHRSIPDRAIRRLVELRHDPESPGVRRAADAALAMILSYENGMEDD